jgi:hypothetical protein
VPTYRLQVVGISRAVSNEIAPSQRKGSATTQKSGPKPRKRETALEAGDHLCGPILALWQPSTKLASEGPQPGSELMSGSGVSLAGPAPAENVVNRATNGSFRPLRLESSRTAFGQFTPPSRWAAALRPNASFARVTARP